MYDFLSHMHRLFSNLVFNFDLTITACLISLFMKGILFAYNYLLISMLFNGAIVFKTDRQISLKYFRSRSPI